MNSIYSNFDFYQNETHLVTEENFNREYFNSNITSFFSDIRNLVLPDIVYHNQNICPYVFMDAKLKFKAKMALANLGF